jgi:hypothetical protein
MLALGFYVTALETALSIAVMVGFGEWMIGRERKSN